MAAPAGIHELRHRYAAQPRRYLAPLASALRQSGAFEEAVTMLRAQLAEYPDHLTGHVVLGQVLFDTGALAESRAAFERARALDPGNCLVLRHLGEIASLAGDASGARVWFGRLRAADPFADDVAAQLGGVGEPPADYDADEDEAPVAVDAGHEVAEAAPAPPPAPAPAPLPPPAADPFELLEFDPAPGAPEMDPVVGLDLPPEAPPAELQAESNDPVAEAGTLEHLAAGPFATETMAGLLAAQGHTEQAVALYERLATDRPGDEALRARLAELRGAPAGAALPGAAFGETLGPEAGGHAARGALLAAAFANLPRRVAPASDDAPTEARISTSVEDVDPFADVSFGDVSFDHFFPEPPAEPAVAAAPNVAPRPQGGDDAADLARFDAWLRQTAA